MKYLIKIIGKSFQSDEEWRVFHCSIILGCRVIKDFDYTKKNNDVKILI